MQFVEGALGADGQLFILEQPFPVIQEFTFPTPITSAHAAIQAFSFEFEDSFLAQDRELNRIQLELRTDLNAEADPTGGRVEIHLSFRDESSIPRLIRFSVRYVVIGQDEAG